MIHAFALEPSLVAAWARRDEYRFVHDKFGLGTPRVMLELPTFSKWKRAVYEAALAGGLSEEDMKRVEELFRLFGEHRCRRVDSIYDGVRSWLENAEGEYDRKPFAAILATGNPRGHRAVLAADQLPGDVRWNVTSGSTCARTGEALSSALLAMLQNSASLDLVDPHFGPENLRHRRTLEALTATLSANGVKPERIRIHCAEKSDLKFFQKEAAKMAPCLPAGITVDFARWKKKPGGDWLHKRYVLTNLGGVMLGDGLDEGHPGETDDIVLLPRATFEKRWAQYVEDDGSFDLVDRPLAVTGTLGKK